MFALELRRSAAGPLLLTGLAAVVLAVVERGFVAQGRTGDEVGEAMGYLAAGVLVVVAGFVGQQAFSRDRIDRIRPWLAVLPIAATTRWAATLAAHLIVLLGCNALMLVMRPSLLGERLEARLALAGVELCFAASMASLTMLTRRAYVAWALCSSIFGLIVGEASVRSDEAGFVTAAVAVGVFSAALLALSLWVEGRGEFEQIRRQAIHMSWLGMLVLLLLAGLAISYQNAALTDEESYGQGRRAHPRVHEQVVAIVDGAGVTLVPVAGSHPVHIPLEGALLALPVPGEQAFWIIVSPRRPLALLDRLLPLPQEAVRVAGSGRIEQRYEIPGKVTDAEPILGERLVLTCRVPPDGSAVVVLGPGPERKHVTEVEHAMETKRSRRPGLLRVRQGVLVVDNKLLGDPPDRRTRVWFVDGMRATELPLDSRGGSYPTMLIRGVAVQGDVQSALRQGDGDQIVLFPGPEIDAGDPVLRLRPGLTAGTVDVERGRLDSPDWRTVATGIPSPPWSAIIARWTWDAPFDVDFGLGAVVFPLAEAGRTQVLAAVASSSELIEIAVLDRPPRSLRATSWYSDQSLVVGVDLGSEKRFYAWEEGLARGVPVNGYVLGCAPPNVVIWKPDGIFLRDAAGVERALWLE